MDLDSRHLRAFVAVVDEGTFTDAAIRLRTTQASVSRSVQRLESLLEGRLLVRSSRGVELTDAGRRVLPAARRVLAQVEQLAQVARASGQEVRVGYAWGALGAGTAAVQRQWEARHGSSLVFEHHNTPTAGLAEGHVEVSVVRRPVSDPRTDSVVLGIEGRYAALASDHPLVTKEVLELADFAGLTVAVDALTGTTTEGLWSGTAQPARYRLTHSMDEWLVLMASGGSVGLTAAATAAQHPRPGITYREVPGAPPIEVRLLWWRNAPPPLLDTMIGAFRSAYP